MPMIPQQLRCAVAGAMLLATLLITPAAAGRQLAGIMHLGKGPRYMVMAPSVGAFYQQRTVFAPAPAPIPVSYVQQAPVVASYYQTSQPTYIAQQPVVAAQPTIVAAQPGYVAGGPHKANLGVDVNMAVGFKINKSIEGDLSQAISKIKSGFGR